ncbi:Flp family type IVb pilin [Robbsia sp. KACC 23696]|uniref:Flp family type IVb pilin n=1 Tax=Robbsia sp. KACC 23696 TaxID=3149231 RepID=UPI00325BCA85
MSFEILKQVTDKSVAQVKHFAQDETGATAIEYGLIAGLIAVVIIGGVTALGGKLSTLFTNLSGKIPAGS